MKSANKKKDQGLYVSLRMDGRVRGSGVGSPPWDRLAVALPPVSGRVTLDWTCHHTRGSLLYPPATPPVTPPARSPNDVSLQFAEAVLVAEYHAVCLLKKALQDGMHAGSRGCIMCVFNLLYGAASVLLMDCFGPLCIPPAVCPSSPDRNIQVPAAVPCCTVKAVLCCRADVD